MRNSIQILLFLFSKNLSQLKVCIECETFNHKNLNMKIITIKIPDKKFNFFMELISHLGFEVSRQEEISDEHKEIVRKRIKTAKTEDMIPWQNARKQFKFKDKSE